MRGGKIKISLNLFVAALVFLLCTSLSAQQTELPFDVNEVVEQLSRSYSSLNPGSPAGPGLRTGAFIIDTSLTYFPISSHQKQPSVAFNGIHYLVVWDDSREYTNSYTYRVCAARVDETGVVLDTMTLVVSPPFYYQGNPAVASDGQDFLVVWSAGLTSGGGDGDIWGARVSQDGLVLDPDGIAISTGGGDQIYPAVAFNGTDYLVVWQDGRYYYDIYCTRLTPHGVVLDPQGIAVSTAHSWQAEPSVVVGDTNCLVVWHDHRNATDCDIYGARVSQSGTVLDTAGIAISTAVNDQTRPSVVFDRTNYLVVWQDARSGNDWDIYATQVALDGSVLDTTGIIVSSAANNQDQPWVSTDNSNCLVAWPDLRNGIRDIYGARIDQSGTVLDPAGIVISAAEYSQNAPAIAFGNDSYLTVWHDSRSWTRHNIFGTRVVSNGVVLDTQGIDISSRAYRANFQETPAIAFDGENYLIVWSDERNKDVSKHDIYGTRVSPDGVVLDQPAIAISTVVRDQQTPAIAFDGMNYFVVWTDYRNSSWDIYGARVDQSGVVLDTAGIVITDTPGFYYAETAPSIAWGETCYLIAWERYSDIYAARVSQSGRVLDSAAIPIATSSWNEDMPDIAFDGSNFMVVYESSEWSAGGFHSHIYGARVSQSGTVLGTNNIASDMAGQPSICFDGTNYLVVWARWDRDAELLHDIYARRVSQTGIWVDPTRIHICTASRGQGHPCVAFDGDNYVIAWKDRRSCPWNIVGAKADTSWSTIRLFALSPQSLDHVSPTAIRGQENQVLIAWSGWTYSINGHPTNTMRIWGKFYPNVGVEEHSELEKHIYKQYLYVYPNPVHSECHINYNLTQTAEVNVSLFDVTGRLISEIINENQEIGYHDRVLDADDLSQGVYFVRFKTENYSEVQKVIFIQ